MTTTHLDAEMIAEMIIGPRLNAPDLCGGTETLLDLRDALKSQGVEENCKGNPAECILAGIADALDMLWEENRGLNLDQQIWLQSSIKMMTKVSARVLDAANKIHGTDWRITVDYQYLPLSQRCKRPLFD